MESHCTCANDCLRGGGHCCFPSLECLHVARGTGAARAEGKTEREITMESVSKHSASSRRRCFTRGWALSENTGAIVLQLQPPRSRLYRVQSLLSGYRTQNSSKQMNRDRCYPLLNKHQHCKKQTVLQLRRFSEEQRERCRIATLTLTRRFCLRSRVVVFSRGVGPDVKQLWKI